MSSEPVDLDACAREPIQVPNSIQPHGALLVLEEPAFTVLQASSNTLEFFGLAVDRVLGVSLHELIAGQDAPLLVESLSQTDLEMHPLYLRTVCSKHNDAPLRCLAHRWDGLLMVEFEPAASGLEVAFGKLYPYLRSFLQRSIETANVAEVAQLAASEIRNITGFDRVMIYRFDENWHGRVIAESRTENAASYLDLWFPSSDIPAQARKLYQANRLRLIPNAAYQPVPLAPAVNPRTSRPLDLSYATLRSVSPVHLEYLTNMGVAASMSISVLNRSGSLWGLIACHHLAPRYVPFEIQNACDFIGQTLSVQLAANEQRAAYERRIILQSFISRLLAFMAEEAEFVQGLIKHPAELLSFASAGGAAVVYDEQFVLLGVTPPREQVVRLVDWLVAQGRQEVYATDSLPDLIPDGDVFRETASGILALSISKLFRTYIIWFRPEVIRSVNWAGDPKTAKVGSQDRISPRKSFDTWKQIVRNASVPWTPVELEAAAELRNAAVGIVLRKAEELSQLTAELQRSNKELKDFSYSVSHDLRAPFRHIVGFAELLRESLGNSLKGREGHYLNTILQSAQSAGELVDSLLTFSQVGRARLNVRRFSLKRLVEDLKERMQLDLGPRRVVWHVVELPEVEGDIEMLRVVWQNLIQNALKYSRVREEAFIEIGVEDHPDRHVFFVRDNGLGFDNAYADKLFGVFQRLHRSEEYEGAGIGLANVRRIVERHGGTAWAHGELDRGATFYFSLPKRVKAEISTGL